ncbi:MAG: hypothetical protein IJA82_02555 [Clostridia bacterium]|nr:hypothetical protein [Clostridia bacterium]
MTKNGKQEAIALINALRTCKDSADDGIKSAYYKSEDLLWEDKQRAVFDRNIEQVISIAINGINLLDRYANEMELMVKEGDK